MAFIERTSVIFLRNRLLLVIVSLLLLGGYSQQLFAACNDRAPQKIEQSGGGKQPQPAKDVNDCCQCLCHTIFSNASGIPAALPDPILVARPAYPPTGDALPDWQPQGIDHPPQLS